MQIFKRTRIGALRLLLAISMPLRAQVLAGISLEEAIDEAIKHNLDLVAERYSLSIAQARQVTAALRPNPVLTVNGQTLDLLGAGFNTNSPAGPNQFNARTEFPIERAGKRERRVELAAAERSLSELQLEDFVRRLMWEVRSGFTDVVQARDALTLAEDNLRTLRGIAEVNEIRVQSGDLAAVELERSRVAVAQHETSVEQARLSLEQSSVRLLRLIGRTATNTPVHFTGALPQSQIRESLGDLISRALAQRPDLRAATQAQARSQADLRLQIANGKVDYAVGAEYSYQRAFGVGGSSVGVSLSVPLPVFHRNQGEILRAQREGQQNNARIVALREAIRNEVELAHRQHASAVRLLENIQGTLLTRSRSVRDTTEYSYRRGEATLVEFLDAQRAFNDSVQTYNNARASLTRSLYLMETVCGSGVLAAMGEK
jgi:cobalt-zinc-cadmium efflux system outer membrane protein